MIRAAIVVAAGSVTLLAAQQASATPTVSLSCLSGVCSGSYNTGDATYPATVNIPYFNVGLGTLNSVSVTITPSATLASGNVANTSASNTITSASLTASEGLNISDFAGNTEIALHGVGSNFSVGGSYSFGAIVDTVATPITPGHTGLVTAALPQSFTGLNPVTYGTTSNLSVWESTYGAGYDPLLLAANPSYSAHVVGTPSFDAGGAINTDFIVAVSYDYTPNPPSLPEPAAALVLTSGLLGLAMVRRRNR